MDKLALRETILKRIRWPVIPKEEYSVLDFGAVPDGEGIQTAALQAAIDTAGGNGGGRVVIPAGRYRTGALRLRSGVELHLASRDTVLSFVSEDVEEHYPLVLTHWESTPCMNFSPLLYACDAHDIAVTGLGVLDGGADREHWWNWHHQVEEAWSEDKKDLQLADRNLLRQMNLDGVPISERIFGTGHFLRPNFIQPVRCVRVLLKGITLRNSPMWQINPVMCESVTVEGVTMSSHGANNDGCDPESCSGVHITGCRFDTGDDCISLKSGRDRDGRAANMPCEYVLIEENEFSDGHGGIALGSEMSGGIRFVLAWKNRFDSPNLTYALRLKTNARRGGRVKDIILADSEIRHVHGAAVHGTMLYEDGRNGDDLPVFRNITVENITAHGGEYGVFLESFPEVPIAGLVLRNIAIDGAEKAMHSGNWKDPVVENVRINGKVFPRPGKVRILGVPRAGETVEAAAEMCGGEGKCVFLWEVSADGNVWKAAGSGERFTMPAGSQFVRVRAYACGDVHRDCGADDTAECSRSYRVLEKRAASGESGEAWDRLICRGILSPRDAKEYADAARMSVTRGRLARMVVALAGTMPGSCQTAAEPDDGASVAPAAEGESISAADSEKNSVDIEFLNLAIRNGFLAESPDGGYCPDGLVSRQEMATVAMQACGVSYKNASSTMPVCTDVSEVGNHYGTNVARALYFGFMELDSQGRFCPQENVTTEEAVRILDRTADFAGI